MSELHPCPSCRRHVAESVCRFCGHEVEHATRELPSGRMSRAAVFASALALGACGGTKKPAQEPEQTQDDPARFMNERRSRPCVVRDPAKVTALEKQLAEAKTDEEKTEIQNQLNEARAPICAPYGAPPARKRLV